MTKEMVIAANRHETKVAVLEDDQLVEVYFQRANEYSLAGSIHKGRVTRVLPGMQSAFVDLGLERDTFLYVSDFFEENEEYDQIPAEREPRNERSGRESREPRPPREEPPAPPVAVYSVPETPPVAVHGVPDSGAAEPAESEPAPAIAPSEQVNRNDGDRDRHRRSRRRRNRGRGFPESKYAAPSHGGPERAPERSPEHIETVVAETPAPQSTSPEEFPVLPGESLAKYRHTSLPTLDADEQEELGAASPVAEHTAEQVIPEEVAEPDSEAPESEELVIVAEAAPEAPVVEEVPTIEESEVEELVADALAEAEEDEEIPPAEAELSETVESAESEPAEVDVIDVETILAEATSEETAEANAPESLSEAQEAQEAQPESAPTGPVEAAVRSNEGRYVQHRISRRMRRKMRSQGRPGTENEPKREGESAAATTAEPVKAEVRPPEAREPRPDPRPETRTVSRPDRAPTPLITDLLKEGQEILVQIAKEPLGQKGARITSHIALPGRYVVYMPTLEHMGVSRKIASDEERLRLKRILNAHRAGIQGGFIVRTAGEGKTEDEIAADMSFLGNLWIDIRQKAEKRPAPALLHHDLDIVQRVLRDQFTDNFKAIWVDNEEVYESILRFVQRFQPSLVTRVKLYTRPAPIFDAFNITPELEKALRPKVWLKSGGYIVINQTEALVAVDVNTGKFVGKSNRLEDTIVKTNTEAVKEIVRQIRLRDLGGIIVVDFIDMDERKNRQKVMQALEEAMRVDKAPYKILQFNDFGLVAITRKRVKQSLERALCAPCPYCDAAGYVKSVQTVVGEILQEAQKIVAAVAEENNVMLRVHPDVAKLFKSTQNHYLEELESILRRPVLVKGDPLLHHEKFDLT